MSKNKFIYDFYADLQIKENEIDNLTKRCLEVRKEIKDTLMGVMLLITAYGVKRDWGGTDPEIAAKNCLKAIVHSDNKYTHYLRESQLPDLTSLGIDVSIDSSSLPKGSWILEFPITLTKPFISKDDVPFYIIENPVRKDKVFGIPFISAMTWKGNLRWVMMKVFLEPAADNPDKFAQIRFQHTLLFGTEKGWAETKSWIKYLDNLCPNAKEQYRNMLKERFNGKDIKDVHLQGMLYFYPTFWDKIDMLIINPHDRKTKAGRKPIHFEVVPMGAKGNFRLVYVPFYWFGLPEDKLREKVIIDLKDVITGVKEMMLTYGFSSKKSSGFGVVENRWDESRSRLEIKGFCNVKKYSSFEALESTVESLEGQR